MDIKLPATITMLDSNLTNSEPNRDPTREVGNMETLILTICLATICRALFLCCTGFIAHWLLDQRNRLRNRNRDAARPVIPPPPPPPPAPLVTNNSLPARFRPGKM
ncbi:uncharacterized protein LOC123507794 [Portunus trituberculatus]|uniref:uncharacterized protein LOC123507794 n=1 Tax=Portunus trituberculatus TaxID=210409 RepID=UPI001E1CBA6A|nr:uncharacterized protein LOC123507794 [Portunus trituberculatus]